jgi:hypothetical protein
LTVWAAQYNPDHAARRWSRVMARIHSHKEVSLEPSGSIDLKGAEVLWADAGLFKWVPSWRRIFWPGGIFFARRNPMFALYRTTDRRYVVKDGTRSEPDPNPNYVLALLNVPQFVSWTVYRVVSAEEAAAWLKSRSRWHARRLATKLVDAPLPNWIVCRNCNGDGCERCDQSGFVEARGRRRFLHA